MNERIDNRLFPIYVLRPYENYAIFPIISISTISGEILKALVDALE